MSEFPYRKKLVIFRGAPVKKDTLYNCSCYSLLQGDNMYFDEDQGIKRQNPVQFRVFHKNTFSTKKIVHTLTTPYRAYINHTQEIVFLGQA